MCMSSAYQAVMSGIMYTGNGYLPCNGNLPCQIAHLNPALNRWRQQTAVQGGLCGVQGAAGGGAALPQLPGWGRRPHWLLVTGETGRQDDIRNHILEKFIFYFYCY